MRALLEDGTVGDVVNMTMYLIHIVNESLKDHGDDRLGALDFIITETNNMKEQKNDDA